MRAPGRVSNVGQRMEGRRVEPPTMTACNTPTWPLQRPIDISVYGAIRSPEVIEMLRRNRVELLSVAILPLGLGLVVSEAPRPVEAHAVQQGPVSFAQQVLPIFQESCVECHGPETKEVELGLTSYDEVMKGSEYGPVVEAGDPTGSILLDMVVAGEMPQEAPPLEEDQIALIRTWIEQGAQNN